jgi:arylsulfatase A-like enzyme
MGRSRRIAILLTSFLSVSACGAPSPEKSVAPDEPVPNVILVVIDALRRDHLEAYGYDKPTSPVMASLARTGIIFDRAFSHGSQTFNSTATLLTSRYFPYLLPRPERMADIAELPQKVAGRHARVPILAQANITLAEILSSASLHTVGIFTNPHHHSTSGFWQGFDEALFLTSRSGPVPYARGGQVHRAFFDWYDNRSDDSPYFAYLHFMDVHNPYRPPRFLRKRFVEVQGRDLYVNGLPGPDREPTAVDLAFMMSLYDAEIRFVDLVIENLIDDLRQRGDWSNTILIVTADHGDEFLDHGGLGHGASLEMEMLHIPLIIHGPGVPARRESSLVRQLDLAPTILGLFGLDAQPEFEGASLTPLLGTHSPSGLEIPSSFAWVANLRSLTTRQWHFIRNLESGETRLYDLTQDPTGRLNLAGTHTDLVQAFTTQLHHLEDRRLSTEARAQQMAEPEELDSNPVGREVRDQLEALGYSE